MKLHIITNTNYKGSPSSDELRSSASILVWQYLMLERIISQNSISDTFFYFIALPSYRLPLIVSLAYKVDRKLSHCSQQSLDEKSVNGLSSNIQLSSMETIGNDLINVDKDQDLVINLTEMVLPDEMLNATKLGVWSVFFGEETYGEKSSQGIKSNQGKKRRLHSSLAGVREFLTKKKVVVSGVQKETPKGEDNIVLYQATTSLEPASLCRTLEVCLQKTSTFMSRVVSQKSTLYKNHKKGGGVLLIVDKSNASSDISFSESLVFSTRFLTRIIKRTIFKFTVKEKWIVLLSKNKAPDQPETNFSSFQEITPPENEFWADPFLLERDNKNYLFIEVFPFERELGHLSVMEIMPDGSVSQPEKILERPYHFSYPNIFEYDGNTYIVPETGDKEAVELYQCKSFPQEWEFKHNLITGVRAYDATFVEHDGLWWMFAAVAETSTCPTTEELHVFYADSPISKNWTAHPDNPVNSDAASARPAGKFFRKGNKLCRPSQDCAGSYGAGINICEIITLNKEHYEERIIESFKSDWDSSVVGLHTLNFNKTYTVSDVMKSRGVFN